MGKKYLAMNIGASTVTLAEYEIGGKAPKLVNYGLSRLAAPLDAENADTVLAPALLEIVREKGIKPGKVAISLPGQMVFPRFAAIAAAGGEDRFDQMVRYEIEQNVPFPIDEMVCDRQVLGDTETGDKAVMIVAAKVDQVEAVTSAVQSVGFSPEIVDVAPLALSNIIYATGEASGCSVLLDIGAKTTSLVIIEGEKIYNRSIPVAGNSITKEIAQILGCNQEEAERYKTESAYVSLGGTTEDEDETRDRVAKACRTVMTRINAEISRSINFYRSQQGGSAPQKIFLTGGTSLLPQTDVFFSESLHIEVQYLNPFDVVALAPSVDSEAAESDLVYLGASAGLALHLAGRAAIAINLMPPSLIEARAEVARIPFVATGAIAFAAAFACWYFASTGETDALRAKVESATQEADRRDGIKSRITAAASAENDAFAQSTNFASRIARRTAAVDRVRTLQKAMTSIDPGLWIYKWEDKTETVKIPNPKNKKGPELEKKVDVTYVSVRCWSDVVAKIMERETGMKPPLSKEPPGEEAGKDEDVVAIEAETQEGEESREERPPRRFGGMTAGMILEAKLRESDIIVPGSVKTISDRATGKGHCLVQFVVKMQFKEPEYK